ncbi:MAG: outer membrane beta-barrel family protein [Bacteroidota bacterium]
MKTIITSIFMLCVLSGFKINAQSSEPKEYQITGFVLSEVDLVPLSFAEITVKRSEDSTFVQGVITNEDGSFELSVIDGNYTLQISYLGYSPKKIVFKTSDFDDLIYDLGNISLSISGVALAEVEVRAKRSRIVMEGGKKVFYVGNDLASMGGSASDLLSYVPTISVDIEGKIRLRGKTPTIQVNGRSSNLSREDVLRMMPGNLIEKVEIITNPSASEGGSGHIINIIMKKEKTKGLNGGVSFTGGYPFNAKSAINLAQNKEPWYIYGLYAASRDLKEGWQEKVLKNNFLKQSEDSKTKTLGWSHIGEIGFEYESSKNTEINGATSFGHITENKDYIGNRSISRFLDGQREIFLRSRSEKAWEWNVEQEIELEQKLSAGQRLEISLEIEHNNEHKEEALREESVQSSAQQRMSRAFSTEHNTDTELAGEIEYRLPVSEDAIFLTGYEIDVRHSKENETLALTKEGSSISNSINNNVVLNQSIHSGFVEYMQQIKTLIYRVGVRSEYTYLNISSTIATQSEYKKYINFLPNLFIQYELEKGHALEFGYERRVRRPRLRHLNPFITSLDAQRIFRGNSELDPEYSHEVELEYIKEMENTTFTATAYAYYENNTIQYLTSFEDSVAITAPQNLGKGRTYGFEGYYGGEFTSWLDTDLTLNAFRNAVDNTEENSLVTNRYFSFNAALRNIITVNPFKFELTWRFEGPQQRTYQEFIKPIHYFSAGVSYNVLKNKGRLILSVNDIFNTRIRRYEIQGADFVNNVQIQNNVRQFYLSFFYRINQKDRKSARQLKNNLNKRNERKADHF